MKSCIGHEKAVKPKHAKKSRVLYLQKLKVLVLILEDTIAARRKL